MADGFIIMKRVLMAGALLASSACMALANNGGGSPTPQMMVVVPAAMGVPVTNNSGVTYMLTVQDGLELSHFVPLPATVANSDVIQIFVSSTNREITDVLVTVIALQEDGNLLVLRQMVKPPAVEQALARFLAPRHTTVLKVLVEGNSIH
jgi:hypothetical protein